MSCKDFLVHADGTQAGRSRVRYALTLAGAFGARLTGVHVKPPVDVPPAFKPRSISSVMRYLEEEHDLDAISAGEMFEKEVADSCVSNEWASATGDMVEQISAYARYSDLVIVGQYESEGSVERHPLPLASALVLACGRPVFVIPANASYPEQGLRVLLAWDGRAHTVRAVHDALPLLAVAARVVAVSVNPEEEPLTGPGPYRKMLADHLRRHNVRLSDHIVLRGADGHAAQINKLLEPENFDLLVMGAYTHTRWFELLFGGTTQSIMLSAPIPVLISH